jgi:hypothetical protein
MDLMSIHLTTHAGMQLSEIPQTPLYVNIHTEQDPNGEIRGQP